MVQFGIAQGQDTTPTTAELLDKSNYALRSIIQGLSSKDNSEAAFRVDSTYYLPESIPFFSSIEAGLRWNESSSVNNTASTNLGLNGTIYSPRADEFADIVSAGPSNFNSADGRTLYFGDYLVIDKDQAFADPESVIATLNSAILANNDANLAAGNITVREDGTYGNNTLSTPTTSLTNFFDITEATTALYAQGNFEQEVGDIFIRGSVGARYIKTDLDSLGNGVQVDPDGNQIVTQDVSSGSYNYFLPRLNVVAEVSDKLMLRGGIAKDIRRPNFSQVSTSVNWNTGIEQGISIGNPNLKPEEVISFDLSAEYFMSDSSFVSIGLFHKVRSNLFDTIRENVVEEVGENGQIERDITDPCEGGGIFNATIPGISRGVWSSSTEGNGICVPIQTHYNVQSDETQTGIEIAFQHDLSGYEETLGWASGFGIIANYTYQEAGAQVDAFKDGSGDANSLNILLGRYDTDQSTPTLDDDVVQERLTLENLSENAYNFTLFYDKYDLSVRARYTWRSAYRTTNTPSFDLQRIVDDRAQLNLSVSYDVTDSLTVGIDGVNLLREDETQWCVNEGALLCAQGITDRRVTLGATARF
ncbi:TonB-dependent receptor [Paraglaciecola aquimarina]|uniref:TonB-dependent receptor n=1 Tax=Paraglaciecola aquimarina TaxID=1235557 RepID=A0ABU3STG5_9ALTE|nr:TonB-dependent receptor [Paraglaciecola aquimarina]MDU0353272.1 TonB-dependent receptor [Paraglaciecola aquimarina]